MGKYKGQLFDSILTIGPHTRVRACSPRQDKTRQAKARCGWHGMRWFGMVCLCVIM